MKTKLYRKHPIVIEASVWEENGDHPEVTYWRHPPVDKSGKISADPNAMLMGVLKHSDPKMPDNFRRDECHAKMHDHGYIDTLEGGHTVCPGDYIIRGIKGEFYPCKPDIFKITYEEV